MYDCCRAIEHLHNVSIQPLRLVGVETLLHRNLADALQHLSLARLVAKRKRLFELHLTHAFHQRHALGQVGKDVAIHPLDRLADTLKIVVVHLILLSWGPGPIRSGTTPL